MLSEPALDDEYLFKGYGEADPLADIVCAWVQSDHQQINSCIADLVDTQISDAEHDVLDRELMNRYHQVRRHCQGTKIKFYQPRSLLTGRKVEVSQNATHGQ